MVLAQEEEVTVTNKISQVTFTKTGWLAATG